jgi:signal peptidase I
VETTQPLDADIVKTEYDLDLFDPSNQIKGNNLYILQLTTKAAAKMKENGLVKSMNFLVDTSTNAYHPEFENYVWYNHWATDKFGPIWIPKKGASINLDQKNYFIYERAIRVYENNEFYTKDGRYYLNGKEVTSYTFKMNYYWMMGDNRHQSQDSRFWGFVPEDHIVGKAWMIWFSYDGSPRWKRFFNIVR